MRGGRKSSGTETRTTARGKPGRPTVRSPELAATICREIAEGRSLRRICASKKMPAKSTVIDWLREDVAFSVQYARAREAQAEVLADEIIELADKAIGKTTAEVQGHRLAVDARKWVASKLRPRKYGDRAEQGAMPLTLPDDLTSAAGIASAAEAILRATCAGDITTMEAQALGGILETRRRAIETAELAARVNELEARIGQPPTAR